MDICHIGHLPDGSPQKLLTWKTRRLSSNSAIKELLISPTKKSTNSAKSCKILLISLPELPVWGGGSFCINYHRIVILYTVPFLYFSHLTQYTCVFVLWKDATVHLSYNTNLMKRKSCLCGRLSILKYAFCILSLIFDFEGICTLAIK